MKILSNLTKLILPLIIVVFSCFFMACEPTPPPSIHEHRFDEFGNCYYGCNTTVIYDKGLSYLLVDDYYEVFYNEYSDYNELIIPATFQGIHVKKIAYKAFYEHPITSITFEEGLTEIGAYAFYKTNITQLNLPNSLVKIGDCAIEGCEELSSVYIGKNLLSFGDGCNYLNKVAEFIVNEENPVYKAIDGNLYNKDATILYDYANAKFAETFTLPSTVLEIGEYAFYGEHDLTKVILPNGLKSIEAYTFAYCVNLTDIDIPDSVTNLGCNSFFNCSRLENISLSNNITTLERNTFENCDSLTKIDLPNSLLTIGNDAFYSCDKLTSVVIPNSVDEISSMAFYRCVSLTNITIPKSVKTIGYNCFSQCFNLSQVVISNGVQIIDSESFYDCEKLTEIIIPISVKSICYNAFPNTLQHIYYAGTEEQWNVIYNGINDTTEESPIVHYNYNN